MKLQNKQNLTKKTKKINVRKIIKQSETHPSLSNAVKQASIAEPFGSSMTIGGVGESIL